MQKYIVLASLIATAFVPMGVMAGCVPAQATIKFSCGDGTGIPPNRMTINYGEETKFTSSTFLYTKCTSPSGKIFGGYIISADGGSVPDVTILGPLEKNNFKYYYTSDITISARWIPDVANDPDTFALIADNPQYYSSNYYKDNNNNYIFETRYYAGKTKGRSMIESSSSMSSMPNSEVGYIMPPNFEPVRYTSRGYCFCKLDAIDGVESPWVYLGKDITDDTCGSMCSRTNDPMVFRSLVSKFLDK